MPGRSQIKPRKKTLTMLVHVADMAGKAQLGEDERILHLDIRERDDVDRSFILRKLLLGDVR